MEISGRKVDYQGKQTFVLDLIRKCPQWVYDNIYDTLEPSEKEIFDAITQKYPSADIRIVEEDFMNILLPYLKEPIFQEPRLIKLIEELKSSIEAYNEQLGCWESPITPDIHYDLDSSSPIVPHIFACSFYYKMKEKLQGIRQKYKNGKLSYDMYQSAERVRESIPTIEKQMKEQLVKYGEILKGFFEDYTHWRKKREEAEWNLRKFEYCYHQRETMKFGKYSGRTISYVIKKDISYIEWALKNKRDFTLEGDDLEEFIEKAGYNPTVLSKESSRTCQIPELMDIMDYLVGNGSYSIHSITLEVSKLPETRDIMEINTKYPDLAFSFEKRGDKMFMVVKGNIDGIMTEKIDVETASIVKGDAEVEMQSEGSSET